LVLIFFLLLCKFVNKIIMFQEALQFWTIIVFCYSKQVVGCQ
jgi:hypothetical protein